MKFILWLGRTRTRSRFYTNLLLQFGRERRFIAYVTPAIIGRQPFNPSSAIFGYRQECEAK
jgi:hypothetical protein